MSLDDCLVLRNVLAALQSNVVLNSNDCCESSPFVSCFRDRRITRLQLSGTNATGVLIPDIGKLAGLRVLNLGNNPLQGQIPSELGQLRSLRVLQIYNTKITGQIPASLGNLNLRKLHIYNNSLRGEIPQSLGTMMSLSSILLSGNELTGPIPKQWSDLLIDNEDCDVELQGAEPGYCCNFGTNICAVSGSSVPRHCGNISVCNSIAMATTSSQTTPIATVKPIVTTGSTAVSETANQGFLSYGALAGIIAGSAALLLILASTIYYLKQRSSKVPETTNKKSLETEKSVKPKEISIVPDMKQAITVTDIKEISIVPDIKEKAYFNEPPNFVAGENEMVLYSQYYGRSYDKTPIN